MALQNSLQMPLGQNKGMEAVEVFIIRVDQLVIARIRLIALCKDV
jgi:hypothetical protein